MPLFLSAVPKSPIWSGSNMFSRFPGLSLTANQPVGEAWVLSTHPDGVTEIIGIGRLDEYLSNHPEVLCGKALPLIKIIDAGDDLSIQVHPDNEYARIHESDSGKNEFWYILASADNAYIYLGFKEDYSAEEVKNSIFSGDLPNLLNKVFVSPGQSFYIPAGTVHAIGKGVILAEVQRRSNLTYRFFDYGRVDSNGNQRRLDIDKALAVAKLEAYDSTEISIPTWKREYSSLALTDSSDFKVTRYDVISTIGYHVPLNSFQHILIIKSKDATMNGTNVYAGTSILFSEGEMYTIKGRCSYLATEPK